MYQRRFSSTSKLIDGIVEAVHTPTNAGSEVDSRAADSEDEGSDAVIDDMTGEVILPKEKRAEEQPAPSLLSSIIFIIGGHASYTRVAWVACGSVLVVVGLVGFTHSRRQHSTGMEAALAESNALSLPANTFVLSRGVPFLKRLTQAVQSQLYPVFHSLRKVLRGDDGR